MTPASVLCAASCASSWPNSSGRGVLTSTRSKTPSTSARRACAPRGGKAGVRLHLTGGEELREPCAGFFRCGNDQNTLQAAPLLSACGCGYRPYSVPLEIEGALGGGAVVRQRDAVVLGLFGGEKRGKRAGRDAAGDEIALFRAADRVAQRGGQRFIRRARRLRRGEQVFIASRRERQPLLDAVQTGVDEQREHQIGVDAAVERAHLHAVCLPAARQRGSRRAARGSGATK